MRVLVVNAGSSSLKLSVVDGGRRDRSATVEDWAGDGELDAIRSFVGADRIDAVGHRVVHGGPRLTHAARVDHELLDYLDSIENLAPLHNPRAVQGIRAVSELLPAQVTVACFDTTFHQTIPAPASTYALPTEWNERWSLRRYGAHGLSHAYAARRVAELVARPLEDLRVVTCHLGSGSSLAAVRGGESIDTTMGFTPLEGLVMAKRSGTVDPGLLIWLLQQGHVEVEELSQTLESRSGLLGLSGASGDVREVLERRRNGDARAALAYEVFLHRLRQEVGAMAASLEGFDLLVFTGGVGEHSVDVRRDLCAHLGYLGICTDEDLNASVLEGEVTTTSSTARAFVIPAAEDVEIARQVEHTLDVTAG